MRSLLYSTSWVITGFALYVFTMYFIVSLNLFSWKLKINHVTALLVFAIVVDLVLIFVLARKTTGIPETTVSFLVCIFLFVFGINEFIHLHMEKIAYSKVFSRMVLSPEWFRIMILIIYTTPLIAWIYYPFKYYRNHR